MADETPQNPTPGELSASQLAAIGALMGGATRTDAARAAGVHRGTLYECLKNDAGFQAELSRQRGELRDAATLRLGKLADDAVDVVSQCLGEGIELSLASRTAFRLLEGLGLLAGRARPVGSNTAE